MVSNIKSISEKNKYKKNADFNEEFLNYPNYKTELCQSFLNDKFCKYGNRCRFAHSKTELYNKSLILPKFKTASCKSFYTNATVHMDTAAISNMLIDNMITFHVLGLHINY